MKKTALALAALLAVSGTAFAGADVQPAKTVRHVCVAVDGKTRLDCRKTASIPTERPASQNQAGAKPQPRLGIDVNPWIFPNTF